MIILKSHLLMCRCNNNSKHMVIVTNTHLGSSNMTASNETSEKLFHLTLHKLLLITLTSCVNIRINCWHNQLTLQQYSSDRDSFSG